MNDNGVTLDLRQFGDALRHRRESMRMSIRQLAGRTGVSDAYIGNLEKASGSEPGLDVLARLAAGLRATPDDLLGDFGLPLRSHGASEIASLYNDLDVYARRAALHHLRTVREMQVAYAVDRGEEQIAAYNRPDIAADAYRESLGWTDEEAP